MTDQPNIPKIIAGMIEMPKKERNTTVYEHYGMKEKEYKKLFAEIFVSVFQEDTKSKAIDKIFPNLSAKDRLKVVAYSMAAKLEKKIQAADAALHNESHI